jgi:hypothetical protein
MGVGMTAELVVRLVEGHVRLPLQKVCRGQSGHPGSDHRHPSPGLVHLPSREASRRPGTWPSGLCSWFGDSEATDWFRHRPGGAQVSTVVLMLPGGQAMVGAPVRRVS